MIVDSSSDWGVSDPLAVPKTARLMLERGMRPADVEAICYGNALAGLRPERADQRGGLAQSAGHRPAHAVQGNSVLRGQQPRVEELPHDIKEELVFK